MKKIISVLLTIVLTFGLPFTSFAENYEENPVQEVKEIYVNPLYRDVTSESDIEKQVAQIENTSKKASRRVVASSTYFTDFSEAGKYMRECMKKRQTKITINMSFPYEDDRVKSYSNLIASEAIKHTGNPVEGDYLSYQYGGWEASVGYSVSGSICNATYNYAVVYYTDANQESEMDTKIQETIANLDIEGKSDYEKIKAVYDYICKNVIYDYKNLDVENYKLKYTAYAALCNGTSVCQGYAVLLYRMALELGIDARVISGTGITSTGGGAHAWNIVKLDDDLYYDADATWDATYVSSNQPYRYFLKNETDFSKDHVREDDRWGYTSEEFYRDYPMADTDYKEHIWNEWKVSEEPECEKPGKKIKTCIDCGKTKTEAIAALGHEYEKSQITQKASFGQKGTIEQKCVRGDASKKTEIPAIVEPTLAEKQYTYNGTMQKPDVSVRDEKDKELPSSEYEITYDENCKDVGTHKVTITLKGDYYEGTKKLTYEIVPKSVENVSIKVDDQEYSGTEKKPEITVKDGDTTLTKDKDYIITYKDNTNAGSASVTITVTGIGNYAGEVQKSFEIKPRNMENVTTSNIGDHIYTGAAIMPKVEVKDGNQLLEKDKDYTISYQNNINVGTAIVVLTGINHYIGIKKHLLRL
ncbi:MAG: transglutaminase-like domain-containing protein [Lachnospiraceae bacterium]|nr:transglutaminase-like domain-containing protein [Lachnospiraceae bacterium]